MQCVGVAVEEMAAHPDTSGLSPLPQHVLLAHDDRSAHSPAFPHIQLIRQVTVVGELAGMQPELAHVVADVRRHHFLVGQEMQQSQRVFEMVVADAPPFLLVGLRPGELPAEMPQ